MIAQIRNFLTRRIIRQHIERAIDELYSEKFALDLLINRLSRNQGGIVLLRVYISIHIAARLTGPIVQSDIDRALLLVRASEVKSDAPAFGVILEVHRELAEHFWSRAQVAILRGKLAHKRDAYSYEGTIYRLQNECRGPISGQERAKYAPLCKRMSDLNRQIEEAELKAWKEQDPQEYERYRDELETRALHDEVDANEDGVLDEQSREVVSLLEQRLAALLNSEFETHPEGWYSKRGPRM